MSRRPGAATLLALPGFALLFVALLVAALQSGSAGPIPAAAVWQGLQAAAGLAQPLDGAQQVILELRLWRALTAAGVGGALALSGVLVQGLFRNALAAPSVLGVTGGASLGATLAILALGGYGPLRLAELSGRATVIVPAAGFVGAAAVVTLVVVLAGGRGRPSVASLLLTGIAINTCIAGVLALVSSLVLADWEVSRAILAWSFGTLDDRSAAHAATVWVGLAAALAVAPFLAWELDLLAAGEEDAAALGVRVLRLKFLVVAAAALSAAAAVAVAGQIAFVGLVVPHLVRLIFGRSHRVLLTLAVPAGACFLLGIDVAQRALLGPRALPPGVTMSLIGGPVFLGLIVWKRREVGAW